MSISLNQEQIHQAIEVMREYLVAPYEAEGRLFVEFEADFDLKRRAVIDHDLSPLLSSYLRGQTPLEEFKTITDGINKRNPGVMSSPSKSSTSSVTTR